MISENQALLRFLKITLFLVQVRYIDVLKADRKPIIRRRLRYRTSSYSFGLRNMVKTLRPSSGESLRVGAFSKLYPI